MSKISLLRQTRKDLVEKGIAPNEQLGQQYLDLLMDIKRRRNEAVLLAIAVAQKPFLAELSEAEEEYAIFLKLAS
jgi:hypothetical protein